MSCRANVFLILRFELINVGRGKEVWSARLGNFPAFEFFLLPACHLQSVRKLLEKWAVEAVKVSQPWRRVFFLLRSKEVWNRLSLGPPIDGQGRLGAVWMNSDLGLSYFMSPATPSAFIFMAP